MLNRIKKQLQTIKPASQRNTVAPVRSHPLARRPAPTLPTRQPIVINVPPAKRPLRKGTLSYYLERGRHMHPLCRDSFIEQVIWGYYHYEQRTELRTCALAAAYVGAFGAHTVESVAPACSPTRVMTTGPAGSQMIWQLSAKLGYDLRQTAVYGPTGRCQPIADEMIQLVDVDGWTRAGIVQWLQTINL